MAQGLNQRAQARVKRMASSLENINKLLAKVKISDLEELCRRDMIPVTLSNSGSSAGFAVSRSGGSPSSSSPTERAVIAKYSSRGDGPDIARTVKDPLRDDLRKIEKKIFDAEESIRQAEELLVYIRDGVEKKRSRETSTPCEICEVLPAVKTAMCMPCYQSWIDAGAPDRGRYRAYHLALRSSDGQLLVSDPPPPRHSTQTLDI